MNPFGMAAGEMPDDVMDSGYDAAEVFKNFNADTRHRVTVSREQGGQRREFVVEVRRHRRLATDRQ